MGLLSRRKERAAEPDLPPTPESIEQGAEPLDAVPPDRRADLDAGLAAYLREK